MPSTPSHESLRDALGRSEAQHRASVMAYSALAASLVSKDAQVQLAEESLALAKKTAAANLAIKEKQWVAGESVGLAALTADNKALSVKLALSASDAQRLAAENARVCETNNDLTSKNALLHTDLVDAVNASERLASENAGLHEAGKGQQACAAKTSHHIGAVRGTITHLKARGSELRTEVKRLTKNALQLEKDNYHLGMDNARLTEANKTLTAQHVSDSTMIGEKDTTIAGQASTIAELKRETAKLAGEKDAWIKEEQLYKDSVACRAATVDALTTERDTVNARCSELTSSNTELVNAIAAAAAGTHRRTPRWRLSA